MRAHAGKQRKGAIVELHHHALERLLRLLVGDLEQLQDHGLILAEHFARGDAKEEGITDLTGGTGDGNADGDLLMKSPRSVWLEEDCSARRARRG